MIDQEDVEAAEQEDLHQARVVEPHRAARDRDGGDVRDDEELLNVIQL